MCILNQITFRLLQTRFPQSSVTQEEVGDWKAEGREIQKRVMSNQPHDEPALAASKPPLILKGERDIFTTPFMCSRSHGHGLIRRRVDTGVQMSFPRKCWLQKPLQGIFSEWFFNELCEAGSVRDRRDQCN